MRRIILPKALSTLLRRNLKTDQMFSVHTTPEKLKNATILDLCLRRTRSEELRDYRDLPIFEKLRFQNVFRPHENENPAFSNSSGLKSVFEKLRYVFVTD